MKKVVLLTSLLVICAVAGTAQSRWPKPPSPSVMNPAEAKPTTPTTKARIDSLQLQREARELSDLANSLPGDMDRVSHGLLPKDTVEKLKRIEKLSKHMRGEINP